MENITIKYKNIRDNFIYKNNSYQKKKAIGKKRKKKKS